MEKQFNLRQNPFQVFLFIYAPIIIPGVILGSYLFGMNDIMKETGILIYFVSFVTALVLGIKAIINNNKVLVVSDKNINLCRYKKNQVFVEKQFNLEKITKIKAPDNIESNNYIIYPKGAVPHSIRISSIISPEYETALQISSAFYKLLDNRFICPFISDVRSYTESNIVPPEIREKQNSKNGNLIIATVLYSFFSIIPTCIGVLSVFRTILKFILIIMKLIAHIAGIPVPEN